MRTPAICNIHSAARWLVGAAFFVPAECEGGATTLLQQTHIHDGRKYTKHAVNSEVGICSELGVRILEAGGNAMDAAVATAICIGTVNSFSSGIGGGGFIMVYKNDGTADMIDGRETAPAGINPDYIRRHPESAKVGGMAVGTPGEVMGLFKAHMKYGRLPWKRLFEENILIARGFRASELLIKKLSANKAEILADKGLKAVFTKSGELISQGDRVVRANYAATLETVANDPMSFYNGSLADDIVAAVRRKGGVLDKSDMMAYDAKFRRVLHAKYKDFDVYTTGLPTAGVLVLEALRILERRSPINTFHLAEEDGLFEFYHTLIETFKFVAARRGELGDPEFIPHADAIVSYLISEQNAASLAQKITLEGTLDGKEYGGGSPACEDHGTTHLNVVDSGNMIVQITSTINLEFGAKFMDPKTGIVFNNQIDDFYVPGVDNAYGLPPMSGNELKPGRRPVSSAAPTLLIKDGEALAIGAAGGTRIPTAIVGAIAYLSLGLDIFQAISECRVHNQFSPNVTYVEPTFHKDVWRRLRKAGHLIKISEMNTLFTSVQAIQIRFQQEGVREIIAVSDPRKHGASSGR